MSCHICTRCTGSDIYDRQTPPRIPKDHAAFAPAYFLEISHGLDNEMSIRSFLQYIVIAIMSLFIIAASVALLDFWRTGSPLKGETLASFIGYGIALLFNVIFNYQVYGSIGAYVMVFFFGGWLMQPSTRKRIGKMLR